MTNLPGKKASTSQGIPITAKVKLDKKVVMRIGYPWVGFLCLMLLIGIFTPTGWLTISPINTIIGAISSKMPGAVYLASLSNSPLEYMLIFCIGLLSTPIHAILFNKYFIYAYKAGYSNLGGLQKAAKWVWTIPFFVWLNSFTCIFCSDNPYPAALIISSNKISISFISQASAIMVSYVIGIYLVVIMEKFVWGKEQLDGEEANNAESDSRQ